LIEEFRGSTCCGKKVREATEKKGLAAISCKRGGGGLTGAKKTLCRKKLSRVVDSQQRGRNRKKATVEAFKERRSGGEDPYGVKEGGTGPKRSCPVLATPKKKKK